MEPDIGGHDDVGNNEASPRHGRTSRGRPRPAIGQMFFIPAYPFWSLTIIAVDVVALWGLCVYGSRANLEAV